MGGVELFSCLKILSCVYLFFCFQFEFLIDQGEKSQSWKFCFLVNTMPVKGGQHCELIGLKRPKPGPPPCKRSGHLGL